MNYEQTVEYLYGIRLFGIKLGLQNIRALLELMGNPHETAPLAGRFIHIAGTNGKGSVAAMLNAIGQRAGLRVGLYTSPHLVSFCERIQVNNQPIPASDLVRLVAELRPMMERVATMSEHAHPTFFEAVTAVALRYFQEQRCDLVIWETGMGGRLDATNVVSPRVSVITNVQLDHAAYLGDTIEKIANEKAGIIKPHTPVVTAAADPVALGLIERTAALLGAPLTVIRAADGQCLGENDRGQRICMSGIECTIPLFGPHQLLNAGMAIAAARLGLKLSDEVISAGLASAHWPGRFQIFPGRPTLVLDGAHNPAAAETLVAALDQHFGSQPVTMILGVLRDKDCDGYCRALLPRAAEVLTVRVQSDRTSTSGDLMAVCQRVAPQVPVRDAQTLARALAQIRGREGVVVVTGSLFLVGEALALLRGGKVESGLNQ